LTNLQQLIYCDGFAERRCDGRKLVGMLKVIGAGLPRTGTTSMKVALERLGFGPCYHMFELMANPALVDRWLPVATGAAVDWGAVVDGYRSTQDWPASHFWRELADAHPRAKVVLTVRDPHAWYPSIRMLLTNAPTMGLEPGQQVPEWMRPSAVTIDRMRPVLAMVGRAYFGPGWNVGDDLTDEDLAVAAFERHAAAVRAGIPPERLLVFDVREGWEPLCGFLGVPVPEGEPFPRLNDAEWMRQAFEKVRTEGRFPSPFPS
jgi:hypothetical protein